MSVSRGGYGQATVGVGKGSSMKVVVPGDDRSRWRGIDRLRRGSGDHSLRWPQPHRYIMSILAAPVGYLAKSANNDDRLAGSREGTAAQGALHLRGGFRSGSRQTSGERPGHRAASSTLPSSPGRFGRDRQVAAANLLS